MKIVLDTNVLVSGIFWDGVPHEILDLWAHDAIRLVATDEMLKEYVRVIQGFATDEKSELTNHWTTFLIENIELIISNSELKLCRDPSDDKFINCAISSRAKYIVSGDKDLLDLKTVNNIEIVNSRAFIKIMNSEDDR